MTRFAIFIVPLAFLGLGIGLQGQSGNASPAAPRHTRPEQVALPSSIALCGKGRRVTCIVDGDTFWLHGEKIRIANIDTPEVKGRCPAEREQARRATHRLAELLAQAPLTLERTGRDRHGRSLARITIGKGDVGTMLVREGLARPWRGRMEVWCG